MRELIRKIISVKNLFGLLYIIFYFIYVGVNTYLNKGNYLVNRGLLFLTIIYMILYIYSVYIEDNKKIKKGAKKFFVGSKKFMGFVNALMIIASIFTNQNNSFFTIFFALISVFWFFIYVFVEISVGVVKYKVRGIKDKFRNKYVKSNKD